MAIPVGLDPEWLIACPFVFGLVATSAPIPEPKPAGNQRSPAPLGRFRDRP